MTKFGTSKVTGMTHSWLTDSLGEPGTNSNLETQEFGTTEATPRVKLSNDIQIFMRDCDVSDSQEAVLKAGVKSEMAYQMQKTMKMIALDVEYAIVNNATRRAGSSTVTGLMGGVPYFNDVNVVTGALTEDKLNDAIQEAWKKGGTPDICVVSGANKRIISGFTGNATRERSADSTKIKQIVDVYESDFGLVNTVLHRLQPDTRVDLLQTEYWKLAYLIPFKTYDKPKNSLLNGKVVTGQLTLECRSKEANSCITIS